MRLSEAAPAKINLALHVRRRRADGYHELETIFAFCEHGDVLEAEAADALTLEVAGPFAGALGEDDDNLVLRAARALGEAAGVAAHARLRLEKRLPVASGLGGGSADAAAALRLLNRLWGTGLTVEKLARIGASLGADVPACVHSSAMRGEGVGDELAPVTLAARPLLMVNPMVAVATGPVFRAWDGIDRGALGEGDAFAAAVAGRNDLETPAIGIAPAVGEALDELRGGGAAILARMSGSGATCFAIYTDDKALAAAAGRIAARRPDWWVVPTRLING